MRNRILLIAASFFMLMPLVRVCAQENNSRGEKNSTYPEVRDAFATGITDAQIHQLNASCRAAKKDLEIAIVKDSERSRANMWTLLTIAVSITSIVIIFVIVRHHLKRRRRIEAEKKLKESELEETKTRLYHNARLVDGFTQRILEKNKTIAELERKIRSNPHFNQSTEAARQTLQSISDSHILTNDDWEKFQSNINKVYPGLISNICDSYPLITDAELRMFLLIKLSVKNKDISEILGISPDSVRKTRFRLKKKLNLREEEDLDDFVFDYSGVNSLIPRGS